MKSGRRLARQCAVQALYQWSLTAQPSAQIDDTFIHDKNLSDKDREFFISLIRAIPTQIDAIDALLKPHLDRDLLRVDPVERAILRLGAFELQNCGDIPTKVALNEAIDLAKTFCAEHGFRFINGVLDKVAREVRDDAREAPKNDAAAD